MKKYIPIIMLLVFIVLGSGCISTDKKADTADAGDFTYTYEFNDIEKDDVSAIVELLNEKDAGPLITYEVCDDEKERFFFYVMSHEYNFAEIEQTDTTLNIDICNSEQAEAKELLLKIKYNPDLITDFEVNDKH